MKSFKFPAPHEPSERASAFFRAISQSDIINYLYWRWRAEKGYEDINDYQKPLEGTAKEFGVVIVKMNRRPFGFNFVADGRTYQFLAKSRSNEFRRLS